MFWGAVICAHAGLVPARCQSGTVDGWVREVFALVQGLGFCESQLEGLSDGLCREGALSNGRRPRRDSQVVSFLWANLTESPHPT